MKLPVVIRWCKASNQWHMEALDGTFIQEFEAKVFRRGIFFFGCGIFKGMFKGLNKKVPSEYIIEVRKREKHDSRRA